MYFSTIYAKVSNQHFKSLYSETTKILKKIFPQVSRDDYQNITLQIIDKIKQKINKNIFFFSCNSILLWHTDIIMAFQNTSIAILVLVFQNNNNL